MMELTIEHQGRELLHAIQLPTRCLQIPGANQALRRQWEARVRQATAELEALYAAGLDRKFLTRAAGQYAGASASGLVRLLQSILQWTNSP